MMTSAAKPMLLPSHAGGRAHFAVAVDCRCRCESADAVDVLLTMPPTMLEAI
jgi:hypothetical protein